MKSIFLGLLTALVIVSCDETGKSKKTYRPKSVGNINSLQVVINNDLWNGSVGEEIRHYFAAPTDGLPQEEPLFSINQMPISTFSGFARKNRIYLYVDLGQEEKVSIEKNIYASPQTGATIVAKDADRLIELIRENNENIQQAFLASEIAEKQKRIRISLKKNDSLKERLGVSLRIPSAYRTALATDDFYWIRKDLKSGSTNIIVYQVPMDMIRKDSSVVGDIIKIRDSIGANYMPVEDEGQFITEEAYAPYLFISEIDGKFAYETKGTWEVKDKYMAGPFLNYAVEDTANNRYVILEGFTYAPSVAKRNLQFELEAILKSAKIE